MFEMLSSTDNDRASFGHKIEAPYEQCLGCSIQPTWTEHPSVRALGRVPVSRRHRSDQSCRTPMKNVHFSSFIGQIFHSYVHTKCTSSLGDPKVYSRFLKPPFNLHIFILIHILAINIKYSHTCKQSYHGIL